MKKYLIRKDQKIIYTWSEYFYFREIRKKLKKEFTFWALEIFHHEHLCINKSPEWLCTFNGNNISFLTVTCPLCVNQMVSFYFDSYESGKTQEKHRILVDAVKS